MEIHVREAFDDSFEEHGYKFIKRIGSGKFGEVYLAKSLKYNTEFAIKKTAANTAEIECLMRLSNPYIIKIYDYWKDGPEVYIVMTYCPNGSMQDYINRNHRVDVCKFRKWSREILKGLDYCHKAGIAHCDLKPANILIDQYDRAILTDFGLGQVVENSLTSKISGTLMTMAPEIIKVKPYEPRISDVWSLGITFYIMAIGTVPFKFESIKEAQRIISSENIQFIPKLDKRIRDIISMMCVDDPEKRANIHNILQSRLYTEAASQFNLSLNTNNRSHYAFFVGGRAIIDKKQSKRLPLTTMRHLASSRRVILINSP